MSGIVPGLISAATTDLLCAYQAAIASTGGAVLGAALNVIIARRLEAARSILLEELRRADKTLHDVGEVEETAAITYRYARAAQEGAARLNLRLMAKVIAGQANLGNLIADEFLYYADIIASLRREEVILLATTAALKVSPSVTENIPEGQTATSMLAKAVKKALIEKPFPDVETLEAYQAAATRTGLLIGKPAYGGTFYTTTPLMDRLLQLAPFLDALSEEPGG